MLNKELIDLLSKFDLNMEVLTIWDTYEYHSPDLQEIKGWLNGSDFLFDIDLDEENKPFFQSKKYILISA